MTESDPFHIDEQANEEAMRTPATEVDDFVSDSAETSAEHPEADDGLTSEARLTESGFAVVAETVPAARDRMLLFAEYGALLEAATERIIKGPKSVARNVSNATRKMIIASLIGVGLAAGAARPAEAIDLKKYLPKAVRVGAEVGGVVMERKAREHADEAAFLRYAPERVEQLVGHLRDIHARISDQEGQLAGATGTPREEWIRERIGDLLVARADCLREMLFIQRRLDKAQREGRTAMSEERKAREYSAGVRIAERIEWEARWSEMFGSIGLRPPL